MGRTDRKTTKEHVPPCKTALVTGGAGFIGANLITELIKQNYTVYSLDNYSTGSEDNHIDGAHYAEWDITQFLHCPEPVDVIFHLAALPRIGPSFENPAEVLDVNVMGTTMVMDFAREHDIPVIYAGSSSYHSGVFKNPYTFSKWQGEQICEMYRALFKTKVNVCRFYNVYGDYMINEGAYRTVLSIFKEQAEKGEVFTVTGDGTQRRDFTHVKDIVDAMILCVDKDVWGETFELGKGHNYSINEIAMMFCDRLRDIVYIDRPKGEAETTLCVDDSADRKLGWRPQRKVEDWINENK